jgi:hypothetical protein
LTVIVVESPDAVPAAPENVGLLLFVELPAAGEVRVTAGGVVAESASRWPSLLVAPPSDSDGLAVLAVVQEAVAGVGSMAPARVIARTAKLWLPADRKSYCFGLRHESQGPPSSLH